MGGQYPPLNRRQVITILKAWGFKVVRTVSSHAQWEGYVEEHRRIVTVQKLKSDTENYSKGRIHDMIRQSGLSKKKFYSKL